MSQKNHQSTPTSPALSVGIDELHQDVKKPCSAWEKTEKWKRNIAMSERKTDTQAVTVDQLLPLGWCNSRRALPL